MHFLKCYGIKCEHYQHFSLLNYSFCCSYLSIWRPDSDQCHEVLTIEIAGSVCLQAEWDVFLWNNGRSLCSAAFAEGRSSREKWRGQKEKLLRAKEEIQGQEESRRGEQESGERPVAQKTESRDEKSLSDSVSTPRQRDSQGKCKQWDTAQGRCDGLMPGVMP